jgi:hypothetical protein
MPYEFLYLVSRKSMLIDSAIEELRISSFHAVSSIGTGELVRGTRGSGLLR